MANKIHVTVYTDRNHVGKLTVIVDGDEIAAYEVAAQADNDAHPGIGYYEIINVAGVPNDNADAISAYGPNIIYLIQRGSTNQADVIIIHGGDTDEDGRLLPTEERGLRLCNEDLFELTINIVKYQIKELELEEKPLGFFKHFTTRRVSQRQPGYINPNTYNSYNNNSNTGNPFFWMWLYNQSSFANDQPYGFAGFGSGKSGGGGADGDFTINGDPVIIDPFKEYEIKHTPVQPAFIPPANTILDEPVQQIFEEPRTAEEHHYVATSTSY